MSRRRELSEQERALWTGFVRSIPPLRRGDGVVTPSPATAEGEPARVEAKPRLEKPRPAKSPPLAPLAPLDRRLRQRVARGREAIDVRIDLHGMTQAQAHAALRRFLRRAQAQGAKFALIVTGKGGRGAAESTDARGVLRRQVPLWLSLPEFRHFVLGFEQAHAGHGGAGALYVRLRRAR